MGARVSLKSVHFPWAARQVSCFWEGISFLMLKLDLACKS